MVETAAGHRVLLAPTRRGRRLRRGDLHLRRGADRADRGSTAGSLRSPSLTLDLDGRRVARGSVGCCGWCPRRSPRARPGARVTDPSPGSCCAACAPAGRPATAAASGTAPPTCARSPRSAGAFDGADLGRAGPGRPAAAFGFSSTPAPAVGHRGRHDRRGLSRTSHGHSGGRCAGRGRRRRRGRRAPPGSPGVSWAAQGLVDGREHSMTTVRVTSRGLVGLLRQPARHERAHRRRSVRGPRSAAYAASLASS